MQQDTLSRLINNPLIDHLNKERETIDRISTLSSYSESVRSLFSSPDFPSTLNSASQCVAILQQNENAIKQIVHGTQAFSPLWEQSRDAIKAMTTGSTAMAQIQVGVVAEIMKEQQENWNLIQASVSGVLNSLQGFNQLNRITNPSLIDTINSASACLQSYSEQFSALREKQRLNAVTKSWFASNPPIKPILSELTLPQYAELTSSLSDFSYWDKADDDILTLHNAYYSGSLSNNEITASCNELVHNPHNIKIFSRFKDNPKLIITVHVIIFFIELIFGPLFSHAIDHFWDATGAYEAIDSVIDDALDLDDQ